MFVIKGWSLQERVTRLHDSASPHCGAAFVSVAEANTEFPIRQYEMGAVQFQRELYKFNTENAILFITSKSHILEPH